MERINIILDEETSNLLRGKKNKSKYIRDCIRVYNQCVTPDTVELQTKMITRIGVLLKEIDSKMDYLTK